LEDKHPEVIMKKIVTGIIIVALICAFTAAAILKYSGSSPAFGGGKAYEIKAKVIGKGDISTYVSASGHVQVTETAEEYFDTPLKVVKLLVEKNQKVTKGQKLLELDMDSLHSELDKLKISRSTQKLALDSAGLDAEITQAESAVESSERAYEDAKKALEKNKALYDAGAISKSELDMSDKAVLDAEFALKNARTAYSSLLSGKSLDTKTKRQNLESTNLSISSLENKIHKINEAVISPIDGIVAELNIQEKSYTSSVQPAYKIVNLDTLQVKATVREYDIKNVKTGQNVKITGDAIPEDVQITGRVESISPIAVTNMTSSGEEVVIEVTISVEASSVQLKPGLSVTCDISTVDKKNVLVAPMEIFDQDKDGNKFVYVVDINTYTMRKTPVKLGISSDMSVEVLEGLKEGDLVVVSPQPFYKDDARVKIQNGDRR
jgi:HlyD family secretion protein